VAEKTGAQASSRNFLLADETLDVALEQLGEQQATSAPVLENGKVVGILSVNDALKAYRRARTSPGLPAGPPIH
jgi:CBS domain-containing protein